MTSEALIPWLKLAHTASLGPKTYRKLLESYNFDPESILQADLENLIQSGISRQLAEAIKNKGQSDWEDDLEWLEISPKHHIVTCIDEDYPNILDEISSAPPLLFIKGDPSSLNKQPCISIVGSRRATSMGANNAYLLAKQLAEIGFSIVSGLAYGIDIHAHKGSLTIENSTNLAILAHGFNTLYPREHQTISMEISENGALISEFPLHIKPLPNNFPRRNRIISGLSLGTVVVEAAQRSGSLITAKYALEQNREVFAVPGAINNRQSEGCHALIQQGAKLVQRVDDILEEFPVRLSPMHSTIEIHNSLELHQSLVNLLALFEASPITIDEIVYKSGLTPDQVSSMLMELEVRGHVKRGACGQYIRSAME